MRKGSVGYISFRWDLISEIESVASLGILTCAEFRNRKEWQLNWHQRSHRCCRAPERAHCALRSAQASVFSSSSLAPRRGWCCYRLDLCSDVVLLLLLSLLLLLPLHLPPAPTMNPLHDLLRGLFRGYPLPWILYMTCYVGCFVATPSTMNPLHDVLRGLFRGYPLHHESLTWPVTWVVSWLPPMNTHRGWSLVMIDWLTDELTNWLTDWLTNWLTANWLLD